MKLGLFGVLAVSLVVSGCKTVSTIQDGVTKAVDFRPEHEKFTGKFIDTDRTVVTAEDREIAKQELESTENNVFIKMTTSDKEDDKERAWGFSKSDSSDQVKAAKFIEAPEFEKYMDGIVARLLKSWPHEQPEKPLQTRLSFQPMYGAETKGDGVLVINLGAVNDVDSEDELAFLLAHEMAHNLLHHSGGRL